MARTRAMELIEAEVKENLNLTEGEGDEGGAPYAVYASQAKSASHIANNHTHAVAKGGNSDHGKAAKAHHEAHEMHVMAAQDHPYPEIKKHHEMMADYHKGMRDYHEGLRKK